MLLSQISEILAERIGKDLDVPTRLRCEDLVVIHRARILSNILSKDPSKKKYYSNSIIVDLEEVNKEECDELADCNCENVLRTIEEIPQVLKVGNNPFDYFGSVGGSQAFGWTTFAAEQYLATSKVVGKRTRYTVMNNRGYIFREKNIPKVRIEDVFADPRKLANFTCSAIDNIPCYSATSDFIADEAISQLVIQSILQNEFGLVPIKEKIEVKEDKLV
jgi:hypothetical protein